MIEGRAKKRMNQLRGGGNNAIEDWFENTFDPQKNGVAEAFSADGPIARAFDPEKNGVADSFRKFGENTKAAFEDFGRKVEEAFSKEAIERAFSPLTDYFGKITSDPLEMLVFLITIAEFHPGFKAATDAALLASELAEGKEIDPGDVAALVVSLGSATGATKAVGDKIGASVDSKINADIVKGFQTKMKGGLTPGEIAGKAVMTASTTGLKKAAGTDKANMTRRKALGMLAFFNSLSTPIGYEPAHVVKERMEAERKAGGIPYIKKYVWKYPILSGINGHSELHLSNAAQWYAKIFGLTPEQSIDDLTTKGLVIKPEFKGEYKGLVTPEELLKSYQFVTFPNPIDPRRSDGTSIFEPPGPDYMKQNLFVVDLRDAQGNYKNERDLRVPGWTGMNPPIVLSIPRAYTEIVGTEESVGKNMVANLAAVKAAQKQLVDEEAQRREEAKAAQEAREAKSKAEADAKAAQEAKFAQTQAENNKASEKAKADYKDCLTRNKTTKTSTSSVPSQFRMAKPVGNDAGDSISVNFKGIETALPTKATPNDLVQVGNKYYVWLRATTYTDSATGEVVMKPSMSGSYYMDTREQWIEVPSNARTQGSDYNFSPLAERVKSILSVSVTAVPSDKCELVEPEWVKRVRSSPYGKAPDLKSEAISEWQKALEGELLRLSEVEADKVVEQKTAEAEERRKEAERLAGIERTKAEEAALAEQKRRQAEADAYTERLKAYAQRGVDSGLSEQEKEMALVNYAPKPSSEDMLIGMKYIYEQQGLGMEVDDVTAARQAEQYWERTDLRKSLMDAIAAGKQADTEYEEAAQVLRDMGFSDFVDSVSREEVLRAVANMEGDTSLGSGRRIRKTKSRR